IKCFDVVISQREEMRTLSLSGHCRFWQSAFKILLTWYVNIKDCKNVPSFTGETSIGKSTLMNTLFNTTFESEEASHFQNGVHLCHRTYSLQESNVDLQLTIVYKVNCISIYFLPNQVNIIPIIEKADTVSKSELQKFKIKIMSELVSNGVQIYQFPTDDEAVAEINSSMNAHLPFAVIGSSEEVKIGNKMAGPMGSMENESHCDFVKLREMLIHVNMLDLREQTHARHCELYRRCKLEEMGFKDTDPDSEPFNLQETYVAKRRGFIGDLQLKEEQRRQMFVSKVKETEAELKENGREEEKRSLEEKPRDFEEEMNTFNRRREAAETLVFSRLFCLQKRRKPPLPSLSHFNL
uniref:Septin 8b n=1 Tax=Cyprinus carpio TaxID=7962 RepID=A0A8C1NG97_CYPCA